MEENQYNSLTDINDAEVVKEPAIAYTINKADVYLHHEQVVDDNYKDYLQKNLDSQSYRELQELNFMAGQPWPANESEANWIDESEAVGDSDVVPEEIVSQVINTWTNIR